MAQREFQGPAQVFFGSRPLAECDSARVRIQGNNRKVYTMRGGRPGLRGRSRGPVESEISLTNAIPKEGFEADFPQACIVNADVRIVVVSGKQRFQFDGWIEDVDLNHSTEQSASISFTVTAGPPTILPG